MASAIDLTLGALEIGTMISICLFGIITVQVYVYTQAGFNDHIVIRVLVATIWVMDVLHTVFLCTYLYNLSVTNYGNPSAINSTHWSYLGVLVFTGIMAAVVQSFFAYRILILSGMLSISLLSWATSALRFGMSLLIAALTVKATSFTEYVRRYDWTIPTALSSVAFGDLLNTSALCYFLLKHRTGSVPTNQLVNKLILWAVETGMITTICAITELILSIAMPQSMTWIGMYFFFPKFYSISMLTSLNTRRRLRSLSTVRSADHDDGLASAMQFSHGLSASVGQMHDVNIDMERIKPDDAQDARHRGPVFLNNVMNTQFVDSAATFS